MYQANEERYANMPVRRVADTGFMLPAVSFGLWRNLGDEQPYANSREVMLKAFDNGIFSFDNASNYGPSNGSAEETFGKVYEQDLKPYRNELVITTKAGFHMWPGPYGEFSSRKTLMNALELSLTRMHLDYVDVFYMHRFDPHTSLEEQVETLDLMVKQGKALYVGVSNFTADKTAAITKLFKEHHTPFVVNQSSYNMINRAVEDDGLLNVLKENKLGLVAYGPLAEGLLTDRYLQGIPEDMPIHWSNKLSLKQGTDKVVSKLNDLNSLASDRGQTLAQMALAWLLHDDVVTSVVIGASHVDHLLGNIKAVNNLTFTTDELERIESILNR
ncbi:MAG: aldo/keto reductase [Furfurilactobacillus sp.]|jgi:L-glyceraldehyde 3-phosphate reductase|uniref:aldo/keto reductase n=1 Tax=Furfurilactobacillus sp. TaxID=2767911 RepID=UPI002583794D|nr:aldo/keto reductase [Furfurilactobacillus sp.]MCH4011020.1 aldo/keto reductase [Furfurilactobacillus sp.]MCH4036912.1 aldo/keto reductase [Furfurilactobacillus sp.]MCH4114142.1 aldo/keto reductase [Furfurilactobacillus sp.]MCH4133035.1 aldo/keto reductase [Furfurilactobacillus sp.]MCI1340912.1 aldo/keto reductase [Furfurilactobacillus sp.]